jgi:cobalt-precorrin-5B (C1)-methyltransferase
MNLATQMAVSETSTKGGKRKKLRCGFSTGTAAAAAAKAALRHLLSGKGADTVAVRLPSGVYLGVSVHLSRVEKGIAVASVIKDGGDDPDITNGAEIRAKVYFMRRSGNGPTSEGGAGIFLSAGKGVGLVTKAGLPVSPGEPAINPVPRQMICDNILREILYADMDKVSRLERQATACQGNGVVIPFESAPVSFNLEQNILLGVEIEVPRGEELAKHTLNPRLGVVGGISILGTTGIVKPFSNKAYEETIQAALSVAASSGCTGVILSTGGKSERFARDLLIGEPAEAFVQVADFFAFAVREARGYGFNRITHSVFFGKAVKMAQGHEYTHAHSVPMELDFLAGVAARVGYEAHFCRQLARANTARHALEMLQKSRRAADIIRAVAEKAVKESVRFAGEGIDVRLLLFDYDGSILADVGQA